MLSLQGIASLKALELMIDYYPKFESGKYYHIFNKGNNGQLIFFSTENYKYFLRKYDHYLSDYLETYAYALLPNHFHFLVRVREGCSKNVSEKFRRLFITYSQAVNKQEGRTGSLFQKKFKRVEVDRDDYISRVLLYIRYNLVKHGLRSKIENYKYSSYKALLSDKPTQLCRSKVLNWFGDREKFIEFHKINEPEYNLLES